MKTLDRELFSHQNLFGLGAENTAFAPFFQGTSYLNPLTKPGESAVLNPVAGTTGISTTPKAGAGKFSSAQRAAAGIRNTARKP